MPIHDDLMTESLMHISQKEKEEKKRSRVCQHSKGVKCRFHYQESTLLRKSVFHYDFCSVS